jgi:alkylation response protein AidB-like acyl-CoA dehydrogenase
MSSGYGRPCDAGVVHEDVDAAVGGDRFVHHGLDVGGLGDVADGAFHLEALLAHLGDGRREPFLATRAQHQRGAGFGQPLRHFLSDSARSAGDDRDAAVESEQFVDGWHVVRLILPSREAVNRANPMTQVHAAATRTGGQFLTTTAAPADVFVREDLSDEQRLFGQTANEFMQKEVLPVVERLYHHDWALTRQLLKKASELDLLRLEIPPAYGGLGLDLISASYVGEQIAINPSFGGSLGAHTSIGTLPLVYFGTEEQKARYLPRLASGDLIGAYALTEPQSGSDALAAKTTATLTADGRHYELNGQKMWITNGGFADLFTVFAKVGGDKFTAFLVERGMGVVSGRDEIKLGLDGSSTTALMLDNVKVPVENLLGTIGQGHKVAFNVLNFGRVKLGARNMSGVRMALNHAVKYAKERRQFGRAIAEFGLIKQKLAGIAVRSFVGDAMSYRTLGDVDRAIEAGDRADGPLVLKTIEGFSVECSINKVWTSEALAWAVDEGLQVFGGNGYSREFPLERMYRDARITRIYEGTNEINRMLVPTRLLKQQPQVFNAEGARQALAQPPASSPQSPEREYVSRLKRLSIALLGSAAAVCGDALKDEQEVLAQIADVVIETYATESALARAEKMASSGDSRAGLAADIAAVYTNDASDRVAAASRQVVAALRSRGADASLASGVQKLAAYAGIDAIAVRRRIANAVIEAGKNPL